jgi:4-hydroxybenzoate polyprenyltransferase
MRSKYFRLLRPVAWITFLLPFSIGFGLGSRSDIVLLKVIYSFIAFSSWMSFSFVLNALADKNVDKLHDGRSKDMNLAYQSIVTGEISEKNAILISIIFLIVSIIFAFFVNTLFFLIILIVDVVGYIYSMPPTRFKAKPIGDILCNSAAGGLIFIAGLSIGGRNMHPLIIIGAFVMTSIFYIPTIVTDYEFDKKANLRTSAIYFTPKNLLWFMYPLTALLIFIGLILFIIENLEIKILSVLIIIYTLPSTIIANMRLKGERLNVHENWILVPFLLLSILFVIYGFFKIFEVL